MIDVHRQLPLRHDCPDPHELPQPPQFFESVCVSAQLPLQQAGAAPGEAAQ
jgi:hypothetical protein